MSTPTAPAPPDVAALRAVRLRLQRLLSIAERFADPANPDPLRLSEAHLTGLVGEALRRRYDHGLVPAARRTASATRTQLLRLRQAEAAARGVPLTDVDQWVPEDTDQPDSTEHEHARTSDG